MRRSTRKKRRKYGDPNTFYNSFRRNVAVIWKICDWLLISLVFQAEAFELVQKLLRPCSEIHDSFLKPKEQKSCSTKEGQDEVTEPSTSVEKEGEELLESTICENEGKVEKKYTKIAKSREDEMLRTSNVCESPKNNEYDKTKFLRE